MNPVPVLDRAHLLEITDGDLEFQRELLGTYRASAVNSLSRLRAGLAAGDLTQVIREAHALKGSSLNVGAVAMAGCAGEIEAAARGGGLTLAASEARCLDEAEAALWAELDRL